MSRRNIIGSTASATATLGMDTTIQIKCLQGWKGTLTLPKEGCLNDFLKTLCKEANLRQSDIFSMIIRGKRVTPATADGTASLASMSINNGAAIMLVVRSPEQRAAMKEQEERASKLRAVEQAAEALSARVGLDSVDDDYSLSITNQDGTVLQLEPTDRKGLALGTLLHAKGSSLLARCTSQVLALVLGGGGSGTPPAVASSPPAAAASAEVVTVDRALVLARCVEDASHVLEQGDSFCGL